MYKDFCYFISGTADDVESLAHALLNAVDTAKLAIINEGDALNDVRIRAEHGTVQLEYYFSDKKWTPDTEEEETVTPSVEEKPSLSLEDLEEMCKEDEDVYI